jgi:preprotein translocase subunit YajC
MIGLVVLIVLVALVVIGYPLLIRAQRRHFLKNHGTSVL